MNVNDTIEQRQSTHGIWSDQAACTWAIKNLFSQMRRTNLSVSQQESLDMIATKIGRILTGNANEPDHWHDIAGYATLVEKELNDS